MNKKYIVFDFDSTISSLEALDVLADLVADKSGDKLLSKKVEEITNLGMAGEIDFRTSLEKRISLLTFTTDDLHDLIPIITRSINSDWKSLFDLLEQNNLTPIVISGGFVDFIAPSLESFGIDKERIFANTFKWDETGTAIGFDTHNPASQAGGKITIAQNVTEKGNKILAVVGDGSTDLAIRQAGLAKRFIAFSKYVQRDTVLENADFIASDFDALERILRKEVLN